MTMSREQTAVYRLYRGDGQLLYVGITDNLERRWRQHSRDKSWWPDVAMKKIEWLDSRGRAEAREREVVLAEGPLHNVLLRMSIALPRPTDQQAHGLPSKFEFLADLVAGGAAAEQLSTLTQALTAVPELQRWLREQRQRVVRTLHERDGVSYTEMAPHLGVKPERVSGIARGHSRSPRKKADAAPPAPAEGD